MRRLAVLIAICGCVQPLFAQSIKSVEVRSTWGGLGEPRESKMVIRDHRGVFKADSRALSKSAVDQFLAAVERPPASGTPLERLGISAAWLSDNAATALREVLPEWQYAALAAKQKHLFINSFSRYEVVNDALGKGQGVTLDDEPEVVISITFADGHHRRLRSIENPEFLAAWRVSAQEGNYETESIEIGLTLYRLLPQGFTNKERLSLRALRTMIAQQVMTSIEEEWRKLGAEARLGDAIDPITTRFTVSRSYIAIRYSIDLNGGETWNADLHDSRMPSNVKVGISLPIRDDKLIGVDKFLSSVDLYLKATMSSLWLQTFRGAHPDAQMEIRFVENRSFGDQAWSTFQHDFAGKKPLLQKVQTKLNEVVFLQVRDTTTSRWLILPDGETILWQFKGEGVGLWREQDFDVSDCYGWKCAGATISAAGTIAR